MSRKTPMTVLLEVEDAVKLDIISDERGVSLSFLIREAVKKFLEKEAK